MCVCVCVYVCVRARARGAVHTPHTHRRCGSPSFSPAGFIIVDLPPEEAGKVLPALAKEDLSFIPLITPTTAEDRISRLASLASSFVYCVSITGARERAVLRAAVEFLFSLSLSLSPSCVSRQN